MGFLLIATLLSVALIAFGGVALVLRRPDPPPASASDPATTPIARLKAVVRARDWRRALPSLLVIAGLLGVMLFGSLALLFVFGHGTAGVAALAVTLFAIARLAIDYARA